jgi:SOS response regulatory protein OraA/RecX
MDTAYNKAIKLLSKQDYSEPRLKQKLQTAGMSDEMIESAVIKLKRQNLLQENTYINNFIRKHMRKGFSISYIREKLERENLIVDDEKIAEVFNEEDLTHNKQIKSLINKKLPQGFRPPANDIDRQKLINRLLGHLFSKGHNIDDGLSYLQTIL